MDPSDSLATPTDRSKNMSQIRKIEMLGFIDVNTHFWSLEATTALLPTCSIEWKLKFT